MCERNIVIPYFSQERKEILLKLKMDAHTMSEIELDEIAKNKDVFIRAGLLLADIPTDIKEKYTINFLKETKTEQILAAGLTTPLSKTTLRIIFNDLWKEVKPTECFYMLVSQFKEKDINRFHQTNIDRLCEMIKNGELVKPERFNDLLMYCKDIGILQDMIKMPNITESRLSYIISNTEFNESERNDIFEGVGVYNNTTPDYTKIVHFTPHMATSIYKSAAETYFDIPYKTIDVDAYKTAEKSLIYLIHENMLKNSTQLDLASRLVQKIKEEKSNVVATEFAKCGTCSTALELLAKKPSSVKGLALNNSNISDKCLKNDLLLQLSKMESKEKDGKLKELPYNFCSKIENYSKRIVFDENTYERILALKSVPTYIVLHLGMDKNTPMPIVEKIAKNVLYSAFNIHSFINAKCYFVENGIPKEQVSKLLSYIQSSYNMRLSEEKENLSKEINTPSGLRNELDVIQQVFADKKETKEYVEKIIKLCDEKIENIMDNQTYYNLETYYKIKDFCETALLLDKEGIFDLNQRKNNIINDFKTTMFIADVYWLADKWKDEYEKILNEMQEKLCSEQQKERTVNDEYDIPTI